MRAAILRRRILSNYDLSKDPHCLVRQGMLRYWWAVIFVTKFPPLDLNDVMLIRGPSRFLLTYKFRITISLNCRHAGLSVARSDPARGQSRQ